MPEAATGRTLALHVTQITPNTRWVFVEISDGAGNVGVGESTLNGREAYLADAMDAVADAALAAIDEPPGAFAERQRPRDLDAGAIVSGVDQALWDLHARGRQLGVADVLAGVRRRAIPVYANINRRTRERTPEGFANSARDALRAGFDAIKLAPFDHVDAARTPATNGEGLARGLECIAAVRNAIGVERRLMVDCHWRFDEHMARQLIQDADPLALHWIECPLPETESNIPAIVRLRALANERGVRLAGLEQGVRIESFVPWCEADAYDTMMPDVKYAGGLREMLRIAEYLAERGVDVSPHNPTGPVSHAASLHVCAALRECDMLEVQFDESPLFDALCGQAMSRIEDGVAMLPSGTGLGMALDRDLLHTHAAEPARVWR